MGKPTDTKKGPKIIKLQIPAGKANPAPPVGSALGQHGVDIQGFCTKFNEATRELGDAIVPVVITVNEDRSFTFVTKTEPAASLILKAANIQKGSGVPHKDKVGSITKAQAREIGEKKMKDLSANDVEAATKIIAGTCRSMGIEIKD